MRMIGKKIKRELEKEKKKIQGFAIEIEECC